MKEMIFKLKKTQTNCVERKARKVKRKLVFITN